MRFVTPGKILQAVQLEKRSWWRSAALVLSVAAVFVTTYALILPALTLDEETARDQGGVDLQTEETQAPEEAPASEEPAEAEEAKAGQTPSVMDGKISFEGKGYDVTAVCGEDAALPENTELTSEEITKDAKEYEGYYQEALKAVRGLDGASDKTDLQFARFYDISLTADGEKIEPSASVDVKLSFDKAMKVSDAENLRIVHFAVDEKTGKVKPEVLDSDLVKPTVRKDKMTAAEFEADSFSVYGVVYTVDFEYEADEESTDGSGSGSGKAEKKTYTYSIEGESSIKLSDLFEALHVKADAADAEKVTFTDEELVQVTQLEDDWELKSLKPFQTEEKLTVSMKDGSVIEIKVTDDVVTDLSQIKADTKYILYAEYQGDTYVLTGDGGTVRLAQFSDIDTMGDDYKWIFNYAGYSGAENLYRIKPVNDRSKCLYLDWNTDATHPEWGVNELVRTGNCNITIVPDGNGGYLFQGFNNTALDIHSGSEPHSGWFVGDMRGGWIPIRIYEQGEVSHYKFTVTSDDFKMGDVSGKNASGQDAQSGAEFDTITKSDKTNLYEIKATPKNIKDNNGRSKYLFDHWELDGQELNKNIYGQTIAAGTLPIPGNGSTLKAVFVKNPAYVTPDDEKEGKAIDKESLKKWLKDLKDAQRPLDTAGCKKTAEVYDYENRVYRVDLTSKANLSTFEGDIDMGFILDVSGSMKFPSRLKLEDGKESICVARLNDGGHKGYLDQDKYHYIIADKAGTATVFRLYYRPDVLDVHSNEYGEWWAVDASYEDNSSKAFRIGWETNFKGDGTYYEYPIYKDDDNGKKRLNYLQDSLTNTVSELDSILGILSLSSDKTKDPDVKIAWNTFCEYIKNRQPTFTSASEGVTFNYATDGGTSTDVAILDAAGITRSDVNATTDRSKWARTETSDLTYWENNNGFNWGSSATKYAILITDGAPQRSGSAIDNKLVETAADKLRAGADHQLGTDDDIKLITVGLSMGDVKRGSVLLYNIADKDSAGDPLFFKAESGDELQYVLYSIIKEIMKEATVQGNVTDTINDAFYPIDLKTGTPLQAGQMIDLKGNVTTNQNEPHGTLVKSGNTFQVKWEGQEFTPEGWHGTVYVKAKEDFLGGNAMTTNEGKAKIESTSYRVTEDSDPIPLKTDQDKLPTKTKELDSPRVNVNELNLTDNSTEWTVYLGTEVDPKKELEELYKKITFEEVVTSAEDINRDGFRDKVTGDKSSYRYPFEENDSDLREASGKPVTFLLKDLVKIITGSEELNWDKLIADAQKPDAENKGIWIPYTKYHVPGDDYIKIRLIKNVVKDGEQDLSKSPHETTVTGKPVESYTLSVVYSPDYTVCPKEQGGEGKYEYSTGSYGTAYQGNPTGEDYSNNTHKINVFAKGLQITKVDPQDQILKGAKFTLYRSARDGETTGLKEIDGKQYFPVAELDTSSTGTAVKDPVEQLKEGEQYYLVESQTPAGYDTLAPIPVNIVIGNAYTPKPGSTTQETKPASGIYDWTQTAAISLTSESGVKRTNADNTKDLTNTSVSVDSENEILYYRIVNNPGVELPKAGGPGTTWLYLLGSLLVLLSGVVLIARRRTS